MNSKLNNAVSHHAREVDELRSDPALAAEYLRIAMKALDSGEERAGGLTMLRALAAAYEQLDDLAGRAGVSREALQYALLPEQQAVK